jgi:DNA modification methylase
MRVPARELVRRLPARSVALLLTDPPYATVDRHGSHLKRWFRGSLSWAEIGRILGLARARLTSDGLAMVLTNETGLPEAQSAVRAAGFARQRLIVWDKQAPGLGSGLRHQVEYAVVGLQRGSRSLTGRDLIRAAAVGPNAAGRYPTEKPVALGRQLASIAGVRRGDLVVDPFCGSGALLVGPSERGALVIGGDISAKALALAERRLRPRPPRTSAGPRRRLRPTNAPRRGTMRATAR